MLNITFGAVAAGAASRYGFGSTKMMQVLAAPAPQHWLYRALKKVGLAYDPKMKFYNVFNNLRVKGTVSL
jgi:hypothetical protein